MSKEPGEQGSDAEREDGCADHDPLLRAVPGAAGRDLVHGRDRGYLRRLAGRGDGRHEGDSQPGQASHDDRARAEHDAAAGHAHAEPVEQRPEGRRHADPGPKPDQRCDDADRHGLGQDGPEHLALARAHRPQQAVLPGALRDRDRERVEDHERADKQGDDREDEHERVEELQELLELILQLLGDGGPGECLQAMRERGPEVAGQLLLGDTRLGNEQNAGVFAGRGDQPLRDRGGEQHHGRAAGTVRAAEPGDAHDADPLRRAVHQDRGGVPDPQMAVARALGVDHDLPGPLRRVARQEVVGVERGDLVPVAAQRRRTLGRVAENLPVLADEPGVPVDAALVLGDAGHPGEGADERGVDERPLRADVHPPGERRLGAHLGVGALVHARGQVVEGLTDRVGEYQGSRHERDAERYREGGGEQPELAGHQAPHDDPQHGGSLPEPLHPLQYGFCRRLVHLVHDLPVGQEHDPVRVARGDGVVGDHDDGLAHLVHGPAHEAEHLRARPRVEVPGRLIGEDDLRAAGQRPGYRDPLLLAAGHLLRPVLQPVADVLRRGNGRHEVERLEHEADVVPPQPGELLVAQGAEVGFPDVRLAGGEGVEAGRTVQQRRLPRPGRAHDGGVPAGDELDGDAIQRPHLHLAVAVYLDRVLGTGSRPLAHACRPGGGDGGHCCSPLARQKGTHRGIPGQVNLAGRPLQDGRHPR